MSKNIGTFTADFIANVDGFQQGIKKANSHLETMTASITKGIVAAEVIEKVATAAFNLISNALRSAVTQTADYGDEMAAASQKTGIGVAALGKLRVAAEAGNASFGDLSGGLRILGTNLDKANQGSNAQVAAFARLGIATKDVHGNTRPLNEVFLDIADRFQQLPDGAEKSAAGIALLGRNADALIPALNEGSEGIEALGSKAARFGAIMSDEAAAAGDAFNDSLGELKLAATGLAFTFGEFLLPPLTRLITAFAEVIAVVTNWIRRNPELIQSVVRIGEVIVTYLIEAISLSLQALTNWLRGWQKIADIIGLDGVAGKLKSVADFTQEVGTAVGQMAASFSNTTPVLAATSKEAEKYTFKLRDVGKASDETAKKHAKAMDTIRDGVRKAQGEMFKFADDVQKSMSASIDKITRDWEAGLAKVDALVAKAFDGPEWRVRADQISNIFGNPIDKLEEFGETAVFTGETVKTETVKAASEMSKAFSTALGNVTSGIATAFADLIFEGKNFGDAMVNIAKTAAKGMLSAFVTGLISPFTEELGKLGAKLASTLGGLIPGVGGTAGAVASAAGGTTSAAGAATSAIGSVAGAINMASGIAGAIGGVATAFGVARLEGTMNAVEYNTRAAEIHQRVMIEQFFHPWSGHFAAIRDSSHMATTQLDAIYNAIIALGMGGGSGAPNMEVVMTRWLEMLGVNWRGSLEDLVRLIRSAAPGVVAGAA